MLIWHGVHTSSKTGENMNFHQRGSHAASHLGITRAAVFRTLAAPRQPCCAPRQSWCPPRQPCCAPRQHVARTSASTRQPCLAPRNPCLAPRHPLKTPRQPYFNLNQKAPSSSQTPLYIQMLACPFGTGFTHDSQNVFLGQNRNSLFSLHIFPTRT